MLPLTRPQNRAAQKIIRLDDSRCASTYLVEEQPRWTFVPRSTVTWVGRSKRRGVDLEPLATARDAKRLQSTRLEVSHHGQDDSCVSKKFRVGSGGFGGPELALSREIYYIHM